MEKDQINIFIIDDDKMLLPVLKNEIKNNFPDENLLINTFEAGELCDFKKYGRPDIAIVDYHMNSRYKDAINGIEIIDMIKLKSPDTEIILFTNDENLGLAVEAFDHGAHDYIVKNGYMFRRMNVALLQCIRLKRTNRQSLFQRNKTLFDRVIFSARQAFGGILKFKADGSAIEKQTYKTSTYEHPDY